MAEMGRYADEEAQRAIAAQAAQAESKRAHTLPPPPGPSAPAIPAPAVTLPPPPPASPAAPAVPLVSTPPPTQEMPVRLTVEQEILLRIGGVLQMIERELELRPNDYQWTYEGCFNVLPADVLDRVVAAPDVVSMFDAFARPGISEEKIAEMKARVAQDPKLQAWLKRGHDELKIWVAEKIKDPAYDPFADEEEEG
jgi:hypothetical protein